MTLEYIRSILYYNPETGIFTWKSRSDVPASVNMRTLGTQAGFIIPSGYVVITIKGVNWLAHQLAWFYHYGYRVKLVDHYNGNRSDNSIGNLREATPTENNKNRRLGRNNKSGYHGVRKYGKRWSASIGINGRRHNLGIFDTIEEAAKARKVAEVENGYSPRHGERSSNIHPVNSKINKAKEEPKTRKGKRRAKKVKNYKYLLLSDYFTKV